MFFVRNHPAGVGTLPTWAAHFETLDEARGCAVNALKLAPNHRVVETLTDFGGVWERVRGDGTVSESVVASQVRVGFTVQLS